MANQGWVKSHRSILDHWVFQDAKHYQIWSYLFHMANHKDAKFLLNSNLISVKRGSFLTSQRKLSEKFGVERRTISRLLLSLQADNMIALQSTPHYSIITICNYDKYQGVDDISAPAEAPASTPQNTPHLHQQVHQPLHTNKNDQQSNNEKNDKERVEQLDGDPDFEGYTQKGKARIYFRLSDLKFPPTLDNQRGRAAITVWLQHKKKIGKRYKDADSVNQLLIEWGERGLEEFEKAVRWCKGNNYQGLFPQPAEKRFAAASGVDTDGHSFAFKQNLKLRQKIIEEERLQNEKTADD